MDHEPARKHLSRRDRVLRGLIRRVGPCTLVHDPDGFGVLVRSIVAQQISTHAARAIIRRLLETLGPRKLTPRKVLDAPEETLRGAGLSAGKVRSLKDLADKCATGAVPLRKLHALEDEAVIDALLPVRGIGRWTAEMFLIFSLGRTDVLPVGDLGLRAGMRQEYGLEELPGKAEMEEIAQPWRPYRSIGTWFLWRSLGNVPQS